MFSSFRFLTPFLLLVFVSVNIAFPSIANPASNSTLETGSVIYGEWMHSIIDELASSGYEGRLTGRPGQIKAAEYIAGYFAHSDLLPLGDDGGYFQYFTAPTNVIKSDPEVELPWLHRFG